jgi:hypothetical protein
MKKLIAVLALLVALTPSAVALAEQPTASPDSDWLYQEDADSTENWTQATDEDAEDAIEEDEPDEDEVRFESALQVYGWFKAQPLDVDPEKSSPDGKKFQVLDERLNTMRALEAEVHTYFSDDIAKKLLDSGVYQDIDGYLYTDAQDSALPVSLGETELTVVDRTDNKITYNLAVNHVDADGNVTSTDSFKYVLKKIDGDWKFTEFPYYLEEIE